MTPIAVYVVCILTPIVFVVAFALGVWSERDRWRRKPWMYEPPEIRAARWADAVRRGERPEERKGLRIVRGGR